MVILQGDGRHTSTGLGGRSVIHKSAIFMNMMSNNGMNLFFLQFRSSRISEHLKNGSPWNRSGPIDKRKTLVVVT